MQIYECPFTFYVFNPSPLREMRTPAEAIKEVENNPSCRLGSAVQQYGIVDAQVSHRIQT